MMLWTAGLYMVTEVVMGQVVPGVTVDDLTVVDGKVRGVVTAMGVRGDKIGSLVSSLITLESNLIFGLSMNEQGRLTDKTYDQAQAMMKN